MKDIIILAIENKKKEVIKEYDNKIQQVAEETKIPNLYYALAQTFHNTREQGEIGIAFLKEQLTDDFFKTATESNGINNIIFENDEFKISFPKSLEKRVSITYKKAGMPRSFYSNIKDETRKLAILIDEYLSHKTFKNFKELADYNCRRYKKNPIAVLLKYYRTYRDCDKKLLDKIKGLQEIDLKKRIECEKENEEFYKGQEYAKAFINSLSDLKLFQECGYRIELYGIRKENGNISYC